MTGPWRAAPGFGLPEPEKTVCDLCGRDAHGYKYCEECEAYRSVFDVSAHQAQLTKERLTAELAQKSRKRIDRGKRSIEDSPIFGGERQKGMFE
ncbi:hypothetical protein [Nevskia soli]|uniref:hypothetical protein n=1 Tax=Nevskia soli TaxID=418856 RepID=UPI0015D935C1|nr:hypothetical protein [Nevskia soli]